MLTLCRLPHCLGVVIASGACLSCIRIENSISLQSCLAQSINNALCLRAIPERQCFRKMLALRVVCRHGEKKIARGQCKNVLPFDKCELCFSNEVPSEKL